MGLEIFLDGRLGQILFRILLKNVIVETDEISLVLDRNGIVLLIGVKERLESLVIQLGLGLGLEVFP